MEAGVFSQDTLWDGTLGEPSNSNFRELERSDVQLRDLLSAIGSYGFYRGSVSVLHPKTQKKSLLPVGVKLLRKDASEVEKASLIQELKIMSQFAHPNILATGGGITLSEPFLLVHEYCVHGSIQDYLLSTEDVEDGLLRKFAVDVCYGMVYLEKKGHVHWDLASRNVFVNSAKQCKIANLGRHKDATDSSGQGHYKDYMGQVLLRWPAPEVGLLEGSRRRRNMKEDVWAYGFFLYELFTGAQLPYNAESWISEETYIDTLVEVQEGALLPQPENCPDDLYDLMVDCWELDPQYRPSFQRIKERLSSQATIDELDSLLQHATDFALSQSKGKVTPEVLKGKQRPPSDADEEVTSLIQENAELRAELAELRKTQAESIGRKKGRESEIQGSDEPAPPSPRPPRKFVSNSESGTFKRRKAAEQSAQRAEENFTHLFQKPGSTPAPPDAS
eukprot:m.108881 g.108881  ORF g.108881 m.108881 type:complete len:447 (-) comp22652_c1_seq3:62-1402(-)